MERHPAGRVPPHKNWILVAGIALCILGAGNWFFGIVRSIPYVEYLDEHAGPRRTNQSLKSLLLEPPDAERERRDIAYAKLDFYGVVQSGGRAMILVGAVLLLVASRRGGAARAPRAPSPFGLGAGG